MLPPFAWGYGATVRTNDQIALKTLQSDLAKKKPAFPGETDVSNVWARQRNAANYEEAASSWRVRVCSAQPDAMFTFTPREASRDDRGLCVPADSVQAVTAAPSQGRRLGLNPRSELETDGAMRTLRVENRQR